MEYNLNKKLFIYIVIILALTIVECEHAITKQIKNKENNTIFDKESKLHKQKKTKKSKNYKRNLNDEDEEDVDFIPFHIHLDLTNFNENIPNELKDSKDIIISAMIKAKETLESLLNVYNATDIGFDSMDYDDLGVERFNASLFELYISKNIKKLKLIFNDQDIHLVILFSFSDGKLEEDDIASAEIRNKLKYPSVGLITLSKNIPPTKLTLNYLEPFMLHLFTHLLGFQNNDYHDITEIIELIEKNNKFYINTPKVIDYANKYFGTTSRIEEIEILQDEKGNLHWPSRILLGEYMTQFNYLEELAISYFTLGFLEDLGYFQVKSIYTGGLMRFGKNKGNDFLDKKCVNDGVEFENEFYYPSSSLSLSVSLTEPSCSSGRQSKTRYKLSSYTNEGGESTIPDQYQYYVDGTLGGFESADYCPVSVSISEDKDAGRCSETKNEANTKYGESFSSNSFCALSSLIKKTDTNSGEHSETYQAVCFEMYCSKKSLTIKVGQDYFVCPRQGGKIPGNDNFIGYLICPDYNLICTADIICNNMFDCVNKKSIEKEESFVYDDAIYGYRIETTQISSEYESSNEADKAWELSEGNDNNRKCPYLCSQCNINGICSKCAKNYKVLSNACVPKIDNCQIYDEDENCETCEDDYVFIDGERTSCLKKSDLGNKYFEDPSNNNNYIKCSTAITNCEQCTDASHCTKCKKNYAIIDETNPSQCTDLSGNEYYLDDDQKYKKCSTLINLPNCKKCIKDNNVINCIECENNSYSLLHKDIDQCVLKSEIESENQDDIFTDDNGLNYYLCSNNLYHSVEHCLKCQNKDYCLSCQKDYEIVNSNKLCLLKSDILSQLYYKDPTDNNYYLCSEKIRGCYQCSNENTCIKCKDDYDLDENDKCIHISISMLKYYLDPDTGRYISCTKIENCEECASKDECTKCQNGYELNKDKNICERIDNNKLTALVKGALALGVISTVIGIVTLIILLYMKFFGAKSLSNINTQVVQIEENGNNEIVVQNNKRSIHNNNLKSNEEI